MPLCGATIALQLANGGWLKVKQAMVATTPPF